MVKNPELTNKLRPNNVELKLTVLTMVLWSYNGYVVYLHHFSEELAQASSKSGNAC